MQNIRSQNSSRVSGPGFSSSLMFAAARMYYEDDLSQQEIANRLEISRPSVSRLLQMARENKIVRIEVVDPEDGAVAATEFAAALGLRRTVIVDAEASRGASATETAEHLVSAAVRELAALSLEPGDVLGVSWGNAVRRVAVGSGAARLDGVDVVPVIGGMDEEDPRFQTNEIVRTLGANTGARINFLHFPALASPALRESLLQDPATVKRIEMWDRLDAALVGIGVAPSEALLGPALLEEERVQLAEDFARRAVGDVAGRYFDINGSPIATLEDAALLSVTFAQLQATPNVVCVGAGAGKVDSIIGASRAGVINTLVTDSPTAKAIARSLGL